MERKKVTDWFGFYAPRFCALMVISGIIIRIILLLMPVTEVNFGFLQFVRLFLLGAVNDIAFSAIAIVPAFILYSGMNDVKYARPWCWVIDGVLVALTFYVVCFNDITDEYGSVVPVIANTLLLLVLAGFNIKLFLPKVRRPWRNVTVFSLMSVYTLCVVLFNIIGEPVFWDEFSVRYNFIAVDYLVYTNEVIGNIIESYPMVPVVMGVAAGTALVIWLSCRGHDLSGTGIESGRRWMLNLILTCLCAVGGGLWLHWGYRNLGTSDMYLTQLQENGDWDFVEAYMSNELDYRQFYPMIPEAEADSIQRSMCMQDSLGVQHVVNAAATKKNVVLVTIESLSASFLSAYGNQEGITPNLDTLMAGSLCFDRLFATGNRTVRGLEAVTLCIPPGSGESIVKRPDNGGLFTTGGVLRDNGYSTTYVYGGDSYFDNMKAFFGGNGYDIHDKPQYDKDRIIFDNIWGTCDEDSYREALALMDAESREGRPFFVHIMTISNHRPYTYPEGRIEYQGNPMCRAAAVKYTDYALGGFIREASTKDWFSNTVFVIMADHCASSAGRTSLPLEGYHIPALIYSPGFVKPQHVSKICSQIDVMPTLFNMLGMSYDSRFYGQDILSEDFRERAFMATYQDLGYYGDGFLTVLSPVRKIRQYKVVDNGNGTWIEEPVDVTDDAVSSVACALYQKSNLAFSKNGML